MNTHLIARDALLDFEYIAVHVLDVVQIREDERFLGIKATCNNIFCIFIRQPMAFLQLQILEQKLLVVGQLDDQRNIEGFLQVLATTKKRNTTR